MGVHSRYGASVIHMVLNCAGYINATRYCDNPTNDAAELGTAAHECAEFVLQSGIADAKDCIGMTFNGFVVDEEMADGVNIYVTDIRALRVQHPGGKSYVEGKVAMSSVAKDVFGTSDHILISVEDGVLYIHDLKYGFGVVEALDNPQIAHYAISTMDTYNLWFKVDKIVGTIVQPRAEHVDGVTRRYELDINTLMDWRDKISNAIEASKKPDAIRTAGKHCNYCLKRGECRTRMLHTVTLCTTDSNQGDMTNEEIVAFYNEQGAIKNNIEKFKEVALSTARAGTQFPGYKLVRGVARAKCTDNEAFIKAATAEGAKIDDIAWPRNPNGKTYIRKHVGAKLLDEYFPSPDTSTTLAPMSSPKSAIRPNTKEAFPDFDI